MNGQKSSRIDKIIKENHDRDQAIFWCIEQIKVMQEILAGLQTVDPNIEVTAEEVDPEDDGRVNDAPQPTFETPEN